jgi:hypothetical protein
VVARAKTSAEAKAIQDKFNQDLDATVGFLGATLRAGTRVAKLVVKAAITPTGDLLKKAIKALEEED